MTWHTANQLKGVTWLCVRIHLFPYLPAILFFFPSYIIPILLFSVLKMSTGSSSLGDLTDLESVKSGLTSNFEDVGAAQLQVLEMAATIRKMNEEMEKLKVKVEDSTEKVIYF